MGKKYTEGQKNATAKYMADKHTIRVVVTKEKASEYKALAEGSGKSLNQFIIEAIEYYSESVKQDRKIKYKDEKFIVTSESWIEGHKVQVEFEKDGIVKQSERVVKYDSNAGDLFITIDNMKYFYYEFE